MEKQNEVKINKMEIQLTDNKISLSMDEAKKLHEALSELFGKKTVEYIHDYWHYRPQRWNEPYFMDRKGFGGLADNSNKFMVQGAALMCNLKE